MPKNESLSVVLWTTSRVRPYDKNPRIITEAAVAKVAASIKAYGWRQPIVVDSDGVVIAGHTRLRAAQLLGLKKVPVHVAKGLSQEAIRAYRLADNRTGEESRWDPELLKIELGALAGVSFDLALTGFEPLDFFGSKLQPAAADPDAPAKIEGPAVELGQIWQLGAHRLICGDATDGATVSALLNGTRPRLMVTDPPYGVRYDPAWRNRIRTPTKRTGKVLNDDRSDWRAAWELFPGDVAYVWHGAVHTASVAESLLSCRFELRAQVMWAKPHMVLGRGDYHWQHEPCWYAVRKGAKAGWAGGRDQTTLWHFGNVGQPDQAARHGTQKPVEAMKRPILNNSAHGDAIYEPFAGSGTTIIAAEMTRRPCFAVELDPAYCSAIIARWEAFTGQKAKRDGAVRAISAHN